jgi:hypothetical protein
MLSAAFCKEAAMLWFGEVVGRKWQIQVEDRT